MSSGIIAILKIRIPFPKHQVLCQYRLLRTTSPAVHTDTSAPSSMHHEPIQPTHPRRLYRKRLRKPCPFPSFFIMPRAQRPCPRPLPCGDRHMFSFSIEHRGDFSEIVDVLGRRLFVDPFRRMGILRRPSPASGIPATTRSSRRTVPVTSVSSNPGVPVLGQLRLPSSVRGLLILLAVLKLTSAPAPASAVAAATAVASSSRPGLPLLSGHCGTSALLVVLWATLLGFLLKELVILATLSFLITEDAEARTRCSLRDLVVMPGNGRMSRLHTSVRSASSRARSPRDGARIGKRELVVNSDCDRLMVNAVEELFAASRTTLVFFRTTWKSGDLGPTVVAL